MALKFYSSREVAIDMSLADNLSSYLTSKEKDLCNQITEASHFFYHIPSSIVPVLSTSHLHEAVEEFGRKIHRLSELQKGALPKDEWKTTATKIQGGLQTYFETIKEIAKELFQQVGLANLEHWGVAFSNAMASIKEILIHHMDDLIWAIKHLEDQLKEFKDLCTSQHNKRSFPFSKSHILNSSLRSEIIKCHNQLKSNYQKFLKKNASYQKLSELGEQSWQKIHSYRRLATLDLDSQNDIKKIYQLLKMRENNLSLKALSKNEMIEAIKSYCRPERVLSLLHEYYITIKKGLFDKSRMIKKRFREVFNDMQARQTLIHNVEGYQKEIDILTQMCTQYLDFLHAINSKADSFLFSRFSKKTKSPESTLTRGLQTLIYDIKNLSLLCDSFKTAMQSEQAMEKTLTPEIEEIMTSHIQEMGQPLASRDFIDRNAHIILNHIKKLDELNSFHPEVVNYICKTLCLTMGVDWKYHVLQEIPLFHQLCDIHHNIIAPSEERQHINRLNKFRRLLDQLSHWVKNNDISKHAHDIDLDINDIKAYLQDFFASLQELQILNEKGDIEGKTKFVNKTYEAVLEYRYAFSKFLHLLHSDIPEERWLQKQFLFADQYFEAIENRLKDI